MRRLLLAIALLIPALAHADYPCGTNYELSTSGEALSDGTTIYRAACVAKPTPTPIQWQSAWSAALPTPQPTFDPWTIPTWVPPLNPVAVATVVAPLIPTPAPTFVYVAPTPMPTVNVSAILALVPTVAPTLPPPTPAPTFAYVAPTPAPTPVPTMSISTIWSAVAPLIATPAPTPIVPPTFNPATIPTWVPTPLPTLVPPTPQPTFAYIAPTPIAGVPAITLSTTYNPASLAAATSRCDAVTVTGIVTTKAVVANPGVAPAAGCVIASVRPSALNTVEVCWRNTFAATTACDTASSTWMFVQP